jgi:hypothetical protein
MLHAFAEEARDTKDGKFKVAVEQGKDIVARRKRSADSFERAFAQSL